MSRHTLSSLSTKQLTTFAVALVLCAAPALVHAQTKLTFALPGIPPVFASVQAMVADKEGFFKKHGVDVTLRAFETGANASRAVASGEVSVALSPSALAVSQISNTDVKLVGIYGLEHPDWALGSSDPNATCDSLKGAAIGVDAIGGARSIALKTLLIGGCKMKIEDVQEVALSSNVGVAMIAGQLKFGVLHIDDIPIIEDQTKKPVKLVVTQQMSRPLDHYMLLVANTDKLAQNRDAYVRLVAGLIEAERFMRDPKNARKVGEAAKETGRTPEYAMKSVKAYVDMNFWPDGTDGLTAKNIELLGKVMKNIGNIKADKEVAPFSRIADTSVWKDARALVKP
jgi:NitT/TauT family transport system substrate-binding protein